MLRRPFASNCSTCCMSGSSNFLGVPTAVCVEPRRGEYGGVRGGGTDNFFFSARVRRYAIFGIVFVFLAQTFIAPKRRHYMVARHESAERMYSDYDRKFGYAKEVVLPAGLDDAAAAEQPPTKRK